MGLHTQQVRNTKATLNAIGAGNYKPGFLYIATDSPYEMAYGLETGNLSAWINPSAIGAPNTFNDTATVDMVTTGSVITANVKLDEASDNLVSATANGLYSKKYTIAAGSSSRLSIDANNQISMSSLSIVATTTDATSTSLAAALTAASYSSGNLVFQNGDMLVLTAATGGTQIWLHSGGTSGTAADWVLIENPNLSDAYVRSLFSASAPLSFNATTGAHTLNYANALSLNGSNQLVWGGALTADTTISGAFNTIFNLGATKTVTIGQSAAGASLLSVNGDMEVLDVTKGLILKNGSTRWRLTMDANGTLLTTAI